MVFDVFVEVADLFALLNKDLFILFGLLGSCGAESANVVKSVDIHVTLVDKHIGDFALGIGEVVSLDLVVIGGEQFDCLGLAQPPILTRYPAVGVSPDGGADPFAYIPGDGRFVEGLQGRVDIGDKHVPPGHPLVFFLIGVQGVVVFVDVAQIIGNQFVPCVIFLLDIGVVQFIKHLDALGSVLSALGVEPADTDMVAVLYAPLFRAVELLGVFLLRIHRGAEPYEGEHHPGAEE